MTNSEIWKPYSWYCPNCGTITTAYMNAKGDIKAACSNRSCGVVMVRTNKGRRHSIIDIYASKH